MRDLGAQEAHLVPFFLVWMQICAWMCVTGLNTSVGPLPTTSFVVCILGTEDPKWASLPPEVVDACV